MDKAIGENRTGNSLISWERHDILYGNGKHPGVRIQTNEYENKNFLRNESKIKLFI
jgi:hypothetical protein